MGDFYVIVSQNRAQTLIFSPTPEISLRSENLVNLSSATANQASRSGRPSTDRIGNYVAFESFQNGFNQIFVQNIVTGQTVPLLMVLMVLTRMVQVMPRLSVQMEDMLFFIP